MATRGSIPAALRGGETGGDGSGKLPSQVLDRAGQRS